MYGPNFINKHSDLDTVNHLSKSINSDLLEKALSHSGLIQKEIQVRGKNGKIFTRKQWISPDELDSDGNYNKPEKREPVEATPHNLTERTKHLVPLESLSELPEHLKSLKKPIPPNWRYIMVSTDPSSEVLAIGKDDMNRTQYIYSEDYINKGKTEKFNRVRSLIQHKRTLVSAIKGMEDKETSDCLRLIMVMGIRPGSTNDTKAKVEALGATTLRGENVVEEDEKVYLRFVGKKGVYQDHVVPDKELANMLLERKKAVGDNNDLFDTTSAKLRKALEPLGIHPKDLRTMVATTTAQKILKKYEPTENPKEFNKIRNEVGEIVCKILGNQRNMALNAYIDPKVFEDWSNIGMKNWIDAENAKKQRKSRKETENEEVSI